MKHKATQLAQSCSQGHGPDPPNSSKRWHYSSLMRWLPSNCNRHASDVRMTHGYETHSLNPHRILK